MLLRREFAAATKTRTTRKVRKLAHRNSEQKVVLPQPDDPETPVRNGEAPRRYPKQEPVGKPPATGSLRTLQPKQGRSPASSSRQPQPRPRLACPPVPASQPRDPPANRGVAQEQTPFSPAHAL